MLYDLGMRSRARFALASLVLAATCACSSEDVAVSRPYPPEPFTVDRTILEREIATKSNPDRPAPNPDRNAYYGDLHVHTAYSMDAYSFGTIATPRDAYRYAKGERLAHPAGFPMQLRQPLDFYAVTDHALFLGLAAEGADETTEFSKEPVAEQLHRLNASDNYSGILGLTKRLGLFGTLIPQIMGGILDGSLDHQQIIDVKKTAWLDTVEAADEFNEPGEFTTFAGFEFTPGAEEGGSLHRNVIFRESERIPVEPFSRYNSRNPEGLWDWLDELRAAEVEALAIPHNSNGSNGQMFKLVDWAGDPLDDDYALRRIRNEPLVEITQVKGTSETHPSLSDTDEWAAFEIKPTIGSSTRVSAPNGSYVRQALREGIRLEENGLTNPFKLGFVAASDTHVGATTDDESNYHAKVGHVDATPELRGSVPLPWWQGFLGALILPKRITEIDGRSYSQSPGRLYGASGLAAVWAEENTRESIYGAFRRKETFATSGPRIRVRFFAGADLDESLAGDPNAVRRAYAAGVSMGSDLVGGSEPRFYVHATRDPLSAPLQRLQIVKGWVDGDETFERVYDVACSDGGTPDPATHRCPDNGATVDLASCTYPTDVGAGELEAVWRDPEFVPAQRAFYYARVLENPTCRWSTWDALRKGVAPRSDLPNTIQERAWSSPIWYEPTPSGT